MSSLQDNSRAALLMVGAMAGYTINDAFMKALAPDIPLFQAIFVRGTLITLLLVGMAWGNGSLSIRLNRKEMLMIVIRSLLEFVGTFFFLTALFNMPMANLSAILQSLPLTVALAAAVFLKEPIGWRRMSAIVIGFFGVLLIVRPGTDGFNIYSVFGLITVITITARDLLARVIPSSVPSMTIAVAASIAVTLFGGFGMIGRAWVPIEGGHWLLFSGSVVSLLLGYIFSVTVMRIGDVGFVAPFRYTSLLIALVLGLLFFDEWPDAQTLIGCAIVVAMGVWVLFRERQAQDTPD